MSWNEVGLAGAAGELLYKLVDRDRLGSEAAAAAVSVSSKTAVEEKEPSREMLGMFGIFSNWY